MYYQFIRPFDYLVWLACIVVIVLLFLGFLLLIKTFGKWKGYKLTNFDGVYGIFVNGSKSGALMEITWLFTIFFLITYYKTELLAHLTSTGYDKPPQNIYGKNISCIRQGVSKDTYLLRQKGSCKFADSFFDREKYVMETVSPMRKLWALGILENIKDSDNNGQELTRIDKN